MRPYRKEDLSHPTPGKDTVEMVNVEKAIDQSSLDLSAQGVQDDLHVPWIWTVT